MTIEQQQDDFNRQYGNTVVRFKGQTSFFPYHIRSVEYNAKDKKFQTKGYLGTNDIWIPHDTHMHDPHLILEHPKYGAINTQDVVLYLSRAPQRQWKLGITNNTTKKDNMFLRECEVLRKVVDTESPKFYYDWFNCVYDAPGTVYRQVLEGAVIAKAFSPRLYMANVLTSKLPVIYYKTYAVGVIDNGVVTIPASVSHVLEELSQYFPVEIK